MPSSPRKAPAKKRAPRKKPAAKPPEPAEPPPPTVTGLAELAVKDVTTLRDQQLLPPAVDTLAEQYHQLARAMDTAIEHGNLSVVRDLSSELRQVRSMLSKEVKTDAGIDLDALIARVSAEIRD